MNKSTLRSDISTLSRMISILHSLDRSYFLLVILHALLSTLRYFVTIIFSAMIIDELLTDRVVQTLGMYVLITVVGNLFVKAIEDYLLRIIIAKSRTLRYGMQRVISEKILTLDFEYMDSPVLHNLRQKILEYENMTGTTEQLTANIRLAVVSITQIVTSIAIVIPLFFYSGNVLETPFTAFIQSPLVFVIFVLLLAIIMFVQYTESRKYGEYQIDINNQVMGINRVGNYMQEHLLGDYKNGKDMRLYDTTRLVEVAQHSYTYGFKFFVEKFLGKIIRLRYLPITANEIYTGLIYVFVILKAFIGAITIGSIMKYIATIQKFSEGSSKLLEAYAMIRVNCKFLNNILELLDLENIKYIGSLPVEKRTDKQYQLSFHNVSFKYPGSSEYVLKNVSFDLNIGEKAAVVGMNGAGKTTMIKLLSRLYDPTEGEIRLNGIDIKNYDYKEYISLFSIVFQDFKLFSFQLQENISIGSDDEELVTKALHECNMKDRLSALPDGIHTYIGKNFSKNGVDFSGGEMQKIAIARAVYKDAPIIIMDEPTAALDPISEYEVYTNFDTLIGDKTAIYISHRLSSCKFCDHIIVFDKGEIIQQGNHMSLLKESEGLYKELWDAQAQYYVG